MAKLLQQIQLKDGNIKFYRMFQRLYYQDQRTDSLKTEAQQST